MIVPSLIKSDGTTLSSNSAASAFQFGTSLAIQQFNYISSCTNQKLTFFWQSCNQIIKNPTQRCYFFFFLLRHTKWLLYYYYYYLQIPRSLFKIQVNLEVTTPLQNKTENAIYISSHAVFLLRQTWMNLWMSPTALTQKLHFHHPFGLEKFINSFCPILPTYTENKSAFN